PFAAPCSTDGDSCTADGCDGTGNCVHARDSLSDRGAVDPLTGFPQYYTDAAGVTLGLCLDVGSCIDPLLDLPDPNLPLSFPDNFPEEAFWHLADALMRLPSGGQARLSLALEAAFNNGPVAVGDQISFARIRIRAPGLTPGAVYTVTHPYGAEVLEANALGELNFTEDVGTFVPGIPSTFDGVFGGRVSNFLVYDGDPNSRAAPPPGFIGNPIFPHPVKGSPCGNNFFRIEGPGLPPGGVSTDRFSVIGKLASKCGNGVVEESEQCDDDGGCCTLDCRFKSQGTTCDDGNACTLSSGLCDTAGTCVARNLQRVACDDGNACTTSDVCIGGSCIGDLPPDCDDANGCTDDSCDPAVGCLNVNNVLACDDGDACTTEDGCSGGLCLGGTPPDCGDSNPCTDDVCDSALGCVNTPNLVSCDDGDACTVGDSCSDGICVGGAAPDCNDGNGCTDDRCDSVRGCVSLPNSLSCDDRDACTTADRCVMGLCVGGAELDCNDGNSCTNDSCSPARGCASVPNTLPCDDGDACTTLDTCSGGTCSGGAAPDCDDSNVCTDDWCDSSTGCLHGTNALGCDDGDACTSGDRCFGGSCSGEDTSAADCDDGNFCTDDACDPRSGCVHTANLIACDDGDACTSNDRCFDGLCAGEDTSARDCDDANPCTND
ncbi:MAG: hypothetical protein ACE5HE_15050, partial [Phycisphaerae bacterium]